MLQLKSDGNIALILYTSLSAIITLFMLLPAPPKQLCSFIHTKLLSIDAKFHDSTACLDNTVIKDLICSFIYFLGTTFDCFNLKNDVISFSFFF